MVNDIQRPTSAPPPQTPAAAPPPERAQSPGAGAGVAAGPPMTTETAIRDLSPETAQQDCEPPKPTGGNAQVDANALYDEYVNIFALLRQAFAEAGEVQSENARKTNEMATDQLSKLVNAQKDIAQDTFKLDRTRGFFKIGGGVSQGLGSFFAGVKSGTPALSTAYNTAGGAGDSIGSGFEGVVDAGKQKAVSLAQTVVTLYQSNQQKSVDLQQQQQSGFDKIMSKQDELNQQDQSTFGASMDALRNPV